MTGKKGWNELFSLLSRMWLNYILYQAYGPYGLPIITGMSSWNLGVFCYEHSNQYVHMLCSLWKRAFAKWLNVCMHASVILLNYYFRRMGWSNLYIRVFSSLSISPLLQRALTGIVCTLLAIFALDTIQLL